MTKSKLTGLSRAWEAYRLGVDQYGTWLYAPAGTPNRNQDGEVIGALATEGVQLIPADTWWVAWWWADRSITVDVATPAVIAANSINYVDLELDLWARDGDHGLVDEDEYQACGQGLHRHCCRGAAARPVR